MAECDLSVIVPAYNAAGFIGSAIRSVLHQIPAGRTIEIIVTDDGSEDDTVAVVNGLDDTGRVRCLQQPNQGPSAARNRALDAAQGRLLMLLDADDDLCEGCLEATLGFMDQHPGVGFFFTNYSVYDESGVVSPSGVDIWQRFRGLAHEEPEAGSWVFTESLTPHIIEAGGFMHTSGLTFRREVYEEIGPFREGYSYGEDDEFYARAAYVTTAGYVDRVLSRKRNHGKSLIHDPANVLRNARQALELAGIQREHYRDDPELVAILDQKIPRLATWCCWQLLQAGHAAELRKIVRGHLSRYPRTMELYRLWLRSWFPA